MKKVFVTDEDHSVWGLTFDGKVMLKKETDIDFSIYQPTIGLIIDEVTGYNESEMYFLVKPNVIVHFKNGVKYEIKVDEPDVTRVNDISIVSSKRYIETAPAITYNPSNDYLAIATNKHAYKIFRGDLTITGQLQYINQPLANEPDWKITNTGFKSVDFQHTFSLARCFDTDHVTSNYQWNSIFYTAIPDRAPYPSKMNCTLIAHHWQNPLASQSAWQIWYSLWGTDEGLFAYNNVYCTGLEIKKLIENERVNDLEEMYALTPIYTQNFAFAATDHGLYYTPASIFDELYSSSTQLDRLKFIKFLDLANLKINSICVDTDLKATKEPNYTYYWLTMCEKVLWLASENGIKKIYLSLDQEYYKKLMFTDFNYSKTPSNGYNQKEAIFETCGDQTINVKPRIPTALQNQLLFQWFKNNEEITDWIGKSAVDLKDAGTYTFKMTALCENITLESLPIIIKNNTSPEITFNYPDELDICSSSQFTLQTKAVTGYKYKWIKDGIEIPNAIQNSYIVNTPGIYQVQVSNCGTYYETSKGVKINQLSLPVPIFSITKTNYCIGETAEISVENPINYKTKWFLNGIELVEFANQNTIKTTNSGSYIISFINDNGCTSNSVSKNINFNAAPNVNIIRSTNKTLCYGEDVILTAKSNQNGLNFLWSTGETTASIKVNQSGLFFVSSTNTFGCTTTSDKIEVIVNDPIDLVTPDKKRICVIGDEKVQLESESGFRFYTWNGNKMASPFFEVTEPGNYTLTVEDFNGCTKTITYSVIAYCKDILMPTAFSPNGDNINDIWRVSGLETDPSANIIIYNRLGSQVYKTNGTAPYWDGKIKGTPAQVGVYYYVIISKNASQALKGSITLIN